MQIAEEIGVKYKTLHARIKYGMTGEKLFRSDLANFN